ncbi:MAG: type II toxin-antitoxin system RelE/ParE family toxin [Chloroflexi bacterium]|nr:type II toxin-antitoxin system RelE/ParE family toxin [Chloroflexota bacterium]
MPNRVVRTAALRMARLADDPRPRQSLKLQGNPPRWRLRFGDHRVIYSISDRQRLVVILRVARRTKDTYK